MNNIALRLMIIDDNPAIHQDFIKVLTGNSRTRTFTELDEELFGDDQGNAEEKECLLPQFIIDTSEQGQEGVEKIKKALAEGKQYALAFVDIRMPPGWDGLETIRQIWKVDKDIQVVICTAYSDYTWDETVQKLGISDNLLVLKKPFDKVAVRQLACALTRKWLLAKESRVHTEQLHQLVSERTQSLQHSLSLLRATIESSTDGIVVVDLHGKIIDYNSQFLKIWNIPKQLVESKEEKKVMHHITNMLYHPNEYQDLHQQLVEHTEETGLKIIKVKENRIIECYSQPHCVNTETVGRVWSFRDITDRALLEQKLEYQAMHDSLTGLPNRILLDDRIRQAIANCARYHKFFAVLFIDLDRFKLVNDSLGHEFGDKLLKAIAKRLSSLIRSEDTLARLGGDEFVLVIPGLKNPEDSASIAQKILTSFNRPFHIANREINIVASMGISVYPSNGKTATTLLKNADIAMYEAKEKGGSQFKFYTNKLNQQLSKQVQLEADLRNGLLKNEFFLLYQPQFNLQDRKLQAVEALLRWQNPKRGLVLPIDFIPLAEESGLIVPLGEWVIEEVCRQINAWKESGLPDIRVAINVGTQQLRQSNFAMTVSRLLKQYHIDPQYIEIEITENVIIAHTEIHRMIQQLKKLGVKIVLDDFGTGNSSLNYLKRIPFDRLKIDQSFVQNINKSRSDEVIIEAIIAMARSLNFKVLAEGVETQNQMEFLAGQRCDEVQGYLLSRPVSADTVNQILSDEIAQHRKSKKRKKTNQSNQK
ncbi:EAL domain-containing protein [Legionella erythra]|uniref:cyclic-guanylate-specific phosphodiesterase n=1 Tax=Legionella erythra TaxID=448 RepID=A0A0W0TS67_LEGER|nr:EAL domain-containing protein [Legionella erythra]KTC98406.1 GGDEF domain-containing sensory box protein [Legionella erythra]